MVSAQREQQSTECRIAHRPPLTAPLPTSLSCLSVGVPPPGHPEVEGVKITCSDDPPRIGSHFTTIVPLNKTAEMELAQPDKFLKVRIATISPPNVTHRDPDVISQAHLCCSAAHLFCCSSVLFGCR